jgi:HEAT repeat protein
VGALADLGTLNAAERQSAYEHLASSRPADDLPRGARHWLVDELITALRVDGGDNAELTRQLANVFRNRSQDPVVRDYALQHLGHLRDEGGERGIIDGILRDATTETQGTIAGTALLALNQNKEEDAGATALAVATDATYDLRSRITAIQVAGKQGNMAALPVAVAIASDEAQPAVLRMSAIATIADLRAAEQRPLLADLSRSDDIRLRTAAAAALKTLSMETSN